MEKFWKKHISSSSQNPFSFSILRIVLDYFEDLKLDLPLKMRESKTQILSGIGSSYLSPCLMITGI